GSRPQQRLDWTQDGHHSCRGTTSPRFQCTQGKRLSDVVYSHDRSEHHDVPYRTLPKQQRAPTRMLVVPQLAPVANAHLRAEKSRRRQAHHIANRWRLALWDRLEQWPTSTLS